MKNKKVWLGLLALVIVMGMMLWLWTGSQERGMEGTKEITVTIIHGDGREKVVSVETTAEYLSQVLLSEGLAEGTEGPYGLEIHTVDGETASWEENQSYWALYIGEEYATTGADGIVLTDGGEYRLEYTLG